MGLCTHSATRTREQENSILSENILVMNHEISGCSGEGSAGP